MVKDYFGIEVQIGHVVLISKGMAGHRNFKSGIVTRIQESAKRATIYTAYDLEIGSSIHEVSHIMNKDFNRNLYVVLDIQSKPVISSELLKVKQLLVNLGKFPQDYVLGKPFEIVSVEKNKLPDLPEFEIELDLPMSLKK